MFTCTAMVSFFAFLARSILDRLERPLDRSPIHADSGVHSRFRSKLETASGMRGRQNTAARHLRTRAIKDGKTLKDREVQVLERKIQRYNNRRR